MDELFAKEKTRRELIEQDLNLRLRQQEAIARLGEFALGCQDLDTLFDAAVRSVAETLGMEYCKVLELMPDGQSLLLRAGIGWQEGLVGQAYVGTDLDSQAGYTLLSEEPVIVHDLTTETRFSGPALLRDHGVISGMSVIIPGKQKPFGVLGTHSTQHHTFLPHDTRFMKAIASILASAIERFSVEDELRRSRDELAIILHGINEGVTVQDRSGRIVYANQSAAQLMGFQTAEEAVTAPLAEVQKRFLLLDEQGRPFPYEILPGRRVMQGENSASAKVRFRILANGEERWSIIDATPIYDEAGNPVQAINIFRDITNLVLSEQYQRFLSEAGELLASSLDYENTLKHVAHLAVTNLADWCSIYLVTEADQPQRPIVAHKDPAKLALAEEYQQRYPPDLDAENGLAQVLRTGQTAYYPVISEGLLEMAARDAEHLEIIRALGMRSVLIVPLSVRGRTLGAITLIWAESGRQYAQRDVELAQELARRAALAIDNARLYQEAQLSNAELEQRVAFRTLDLLQSHQRLEMEMNERLKTAQALEKSEMMLNSLFESAPDATLLVDQFGKVVRVNQQAEAMFNCPRDRLVGMPIEKLIPQRYRQEHAGKRKRYMMENVTRSMGAGLELSALRIDGSEFPVDIMLSPVQTEAGEMVICAVRNMTEQKRLQAELAETHRRLFEGIEEERLRISQDLHDGPIQDLYALALYLETVRDYMPDEQQQEDFQGTMNNLQAIVQSLRSICGELRPPTLSQFGLEKAIRSHLVKLREKYPNVQIEAQLMSDGLALSERTRLALFRVYQNALANIFRHSGASHIWVDFRIEDGELRLEIKDNGRGFNVPGKWIDLAREGHYGLVGMAERVEAIHGRLQVESAVGQGTTIRVVVPMEKSVLAEVA